MSLHGWLILDKPVGLGSTQAVSAVKRALREGGYGKAKVGHGGTLDPLASGVLPVAIGEATKLAGRLLDGDKTYSFTLTFGEETDTLDAEGAVIAASEVRPLRKDIEAVTARFTGAIEQRPPSYSALKVGGARAYDLARAGETVALAPRSVTIHSLEARGTLAEARVDAEAPDLDGDALRRWHRGRCAGRFEPVRAAEFTAAVSKGTYIRSLARDIAHALGTVGHVTRLHRTKAGPFTIHQAIGVDKLAEAAKGRTLEHLLLPLRAGLDDIPALALTPDQAGALRQGRVLAGIAADDGSAFAMLGDVPVALVEVEDREVRVVRGFNL